MQCEQVGYFIENWMKAEVLWIKAAEVTCKNISFLCSEFLRRQTNRSR
jgi:Ni,Fe-hydrogenase I small subunit